MSQEFQYYYSLLLLLLFYMYILLSLRVAKLFSNLELFITK